MVITYLGQAYIYRVATLFQATLSNGAVTWAYPTQEQAAAAARAGAFFVRGVLVENGNYWCVVPERQPEPEKEPECTSRELEVKKFVGW